MIHRPEISLVRDVSGEIFRRKPQMTQRDNGEKAAESGPHT